MDMAKSSIMRIGIERNPSRSPSGLKMVAICPEKLHPKSKVWIEEEKFDKPTWRISRIEIPGCRPFTVRSDGSVGINVRRLDVDFTSRKAAEFMILDADSIRIGGVNMRPKPSWF